MEYHLIFDMEYHLIWNIIDAFENIDIALVCMVGVTILS